jgi:peroxiredoxin Q/BCP
MKRFTGSLVSAFISAFAVAVACSAQTTQPAPDAAPAAAPQAAPATQPAEAMSAAIPAVGTPAPAFTLTTNTGTKVSLSDFAGKQIVVLYFYPKAGTPGCTTEACAFRDALAEYDKENIAVLGISPDPVDAIGTFGTQYHLNFPLLADTDHAVAQAYGVWQQHVNKAGDTVYGVARTTFVIGKDGNILHVFEKVHPKGHDQEVLAWIKANVDPASKS